MGAVGQKHASSGRKPNAGLRIAGLFAGVGGLELGLQAAGHHASLLCEWDEGAQAVLRARFPGRRIDGDVRDLKRLPATVDLVAAGFPCQNLSQAGDTAGIRGEKSSLVGQVFRLLRDRPVPWVVLENVPFMLHLDRGRAMRHVVDELEDIGYRWAYRVVDSMAFGLPQRRRRVFLVASLDTDPADVLFADDAAPRQSAEWSPAVAAGFYWTEGNRGVGWAIDAVPTLKGGSGLGIPSAPAVLKADGALVTPSLEGAERLQGFPAGWTQPAEKKVPGRYRWRMVGNAVNVRAAEWLGERIAEPGSMPGRRLGAELAAKAPWPNAACSRDGRRHAVSIGEWPKRELLEPIETFLDGGKPLSARATEGFVTRAERAERTGKLTFPPMFLDALRAHLESVRPVNV